MEDHAGSRLAPPPQSWDHRCSAPCPDWLAAWFVHLFWFYKIYFYHVFPSLASSQIPPHPTFCSLSLLEKERNQNKQTKKPNADQKKKSQNETHKQNGIHFGLENSSWAQGLPWHGGYPGM
jgi:hypothetical protein